MADKEKNYVIEPPGEIAFPPFCCRRGCDHPRPDGDGPPPAGWTFLAVMRTGMKGQSLTFCPDHDPLAGAEIMDPSTRGPLRPSPVDDDQAEASPLATPGGAPVVHGPDEVYDGRLPPRV